MNLNDKVSDVCIDGNWLWPVHIVQKIGDLLVYPNHVLRDEERDRLYWKTRLDKLCDFSTSGVWDDIRAFRDEVSWHRVIWFSQNIPRHSFICWVAINCKLSTQDRLERWDVPCGSVCCLCDKVKESHDHLLIGCSYAKSVWRWFRGKAGLDGIIDRIEHGHSQWNDVINAMAGTVCNKGVWSIIIRLVFVAVIYFLWQERNARTFRNDVSSHEVIAKRIYEVVRLRLMGLQVKKSMQSQSAAKVWHFNFDDGGGTHLSV
ncbi:uncharacterized protein [Rutidosis leptorrhynchoides]|uniref:uncharacterized protein n=1 Tax=Rutidosis leptorrhynchoides TaxID=125765 RepID=UPI003A9936F2